MANQFSVEPANPLQALMAGVQGYDRGRASAKEAEIGAGRQEAMAALQSGADPSSALARLIGVGDIQGATVLAKLHETQNQQGGVYGTPIYGQGPGGETQIGTFDKRGQFRRVDTGGFTPTLPVKPLDTGTGFVMTPGRAPFVGGQPSGPSRGPQLDINSEGIPPSQAARVNGQQPGSAAPMQPTPVQTQPIRPTPGFIPKDVQGREAAEARGQAQGKAQANYPQIVSAATTSLKLLDEAISHPGREIATGTSRLFDPRNYELGAAVTGNRSAFDFDARAKQLEGRVFLDAFDQLRGGGAITEAEGNKATAAHGRLMRSQSDEEYLAALKELRGIISKGVKVARMKAAGRNDLADRELGLNIPDGEVTTPGQSSIDDLVKKYQ